MTAKSFLALNETPPASSPPSAITSTRASLFARQAPSASTSSDLISAQDLIKTADEHWNVSGASVIGAWLLTILLGILIATVFSSVRTKEKWTLFYAPRVESQKNKAKKWHGKPGTFAPLIPILDKSYFGWLVPQLKGFWMELWQPVRKRAVRERDIELLEMIGLDGVTYLQFLRLLRWLFLTITLFAALPLTIANYYINTSTEYGSRSASSATESMSALAQEAKAMNAEDGKEMGKALVDDMMVFTAAYVKGNGLWVHIGFEWAVTTFVILFVVAYSSHYDTLVRRWIETNYNDTCFRSLLVTDFKIGPKRWTSDEKGTRYQKTNYVSDAKDQVCLMLGIPERPYGKAGPEVTVTLTYRNMTRLSDLMDIFKEELFPDFAGTLTAYLRRNKRQFGDGAIYEGCWDRIKGNSRNVIRLTEAKGKKLLEAKLKIALTQAAAKCDTASEVVTKVEGEITSAFVTFISTKRAYQALKAFQAKEKLHEKITGPDVQRAPRAKNIIWQNLDKVGLSKRGYSFTGVLILLFVFTFNLIPLAVITLLANYEALLEYSPMLKKANETSTFWSAVFALLGGIVPPSISALFAYLLPYIVRRLNKWSGALTRGELDKTVVRQLFIWLLVFNFIFFSLMGIIWETFLTIKEEIGTKSSGEIWASLGDIPAKVTRAYISQSSYWLSWYPYVRRSIYANIFGEWFWIRALVICVQLLQLPRIVLKIIESFYAKTATDLHELAQPPKFEFAIEYVHALFAMAVALVLTPLAPIVAMCSTIYFWAMTVVHYNTLNYVEDSKETDGKLWRIARNRLLAATVIMQLLMTLTIALKTLTPLPTILAALPILLIIFLKYKEGEDDLFIKASELISEADLACSISSAGGPIPEYEHDLLRTDWMPEFHYIQEDRVEYLRALDRDGFEWMRPLFVKSDWEEYLARGGREKKRGRRGRKEKREGKGK